MRSATQQSALGSLLLAFALGIATPVMAQSGESEQGEMSKDGQMMKDSMAKDSMAKDGAMMKEDGAMTKDDAMAKDKMAMAPHGVFTAAEGHKASGKVEVVTANGKSQLRLGNDFSMERGPDVYVVLSPAAAMAKSGTTRLGKVKRFSGAQTFDIPAGTDLSAATHVVLWCKKYNVLMGTAALATGDAMGQ